MSAIVCVHCNSLLILDLDQLNRTLVCPACKNMIPKGSSLLTFEELTVRLRTGHADFVCPHCRVMLIAGPSDQRQAMTCPSCLRLIPRSAPKAVG
jgi:DNA-directed RNA polymerase subunit M/transcription elongation factor TFIIS